jgi:pimeloyl-ACP methyl ester carboxylesterase
MTILTTCLIIILFMVSMHAFYRRYYYQPRNYDEIHFARTDDGWRIAIHRYLPRSNEKKAIPVLLCHGMGTNRYHFDLANHKSLALALSKIGYDVWLMELRGSGESSRPSLFNHYKYSWSFDTFIQLDIPAALNKIKKTTNCSQIHWIGHSMGGMIIYGYLQRPDASLIASATCIGSPSSFRHQIYLRPVAIALALFRFIPVVPVRILAALVSPLIRKPLPYLFKLSFNPQNTDYKLLRRMMMNGMSDISIKTARQMAAWILEGHMKTEDGKYDYRANLDLITTPLFLIGGNKDYLAPPPSLQESFDRVSSEMKKIRIFGKEYGDRYDYGHGDLLIGKGVEDEIFPEIVQNLAEVEQALANALPGQALTTPETAQPATTTSPAVTV